MKKLMVQSFLGRAGPALLGAAVFMLSLLTFGLVFGVSTPDEYPREIIGALIGTLMAAVITTLLLRYQTAGEEIREKNVEVFKRKVDAYQGFIEQSLLHLEDWTLTQEESQSLRRSVYSMSLISSTKTVENVIQFLRGHLLGEGHGDIHDVVNAFREELSLEALDETAHLNMEAIDAKLRGETDADKATLSREYLEQIGNSIIDVLRQRDPELFNAVDVADISGSLDGAQSCMTMTSGIELIVHLPYRTSEEPEVLSGFIDFEGLPRPRRTLFKKQALALGFLNEAEDPTSVDFLLDPGLDGVPGGLSEGRPVWTLAELAKAVTVLEKEALGPGRRPKGRGHRD